MRETRPSRLGRYRPSSAVFKALGHPARLLMVDKLSRGELCVCELKALVGFEMATVSRHLAVLREAGVVADEKRGQQVYYSLRTPCVTQLLGCVGGVCGGSMRRG